MHQSLGQQHRFLQAIWQKSWFGNVFCRWGLFLVVVNADNPKLAQHNNATKVFLFYTFGKKLSKFNQAYMKFKKMKSLWRKYDKLNCSIQLNDFIKRIKVSLADILQCFQKVLKGWAFHMIFGWTACCNPWLIKCNRFAMCSKLYLLVFDGQDQADHLVQSDLI